MKKINSTALHEAGHMFASKKWGNGYSWATANPKGLRAGAAGATLVNPVKIQNRWDARKMLYITVAGDVAKDMFSGIRCLRIHHADYEKSRQLASYITNSDDLKIITACILKCMKTVSKLFSTPKASKEILRLTKSL